MEILKNTKTYGNSFYDKKFFFENVNFIKPIKKITVFFDYENFLLTSYETDRGTTFVAEGWNGDQIHLTGLNCGYGGTGPNKMADVLISLGMEKEMAYDLMYYPGLEIPFDKKGIIIKENIKKKAYFSSQGEHLNKCKVHLNDLVYFNYLEKKLYFINPQYKYIRDLYNAIDEINPTYFQYYVGDNSTLDNGYLPNILDYDLKKHLTGVNLILIGEKFQINVLIDKNLSRTVINMIYCYITGEPLFDDLDFLKKPESRIKSYLFQILDKNECHEQRKIKLNHSRKNRYV